MGENSPTWIQSTDLICTEAKERKDLAEEMNFFASLAFLTIAANCCLAQDGDELLVGDFKEEPTRDDEFILPNVEEVDDDFTKSISNNRRRPSEGLVDVDISRLALQLKSGDIDSFVEDRVEGDVAKVASRDELVSRTNLKQANLYIQFFEASKWKYNSCCPRIQSYQCGVNTQTLPCRFEWPYGWCCPLQSVYIRTCNCGKCHRLCKDCVHEGRCIPRYSYRSYLAVCWNWWWARIVHFNKYLPTSCTCDAKAC